MGNWSWQVSLAAFLRHRFCVIPCFNVHQDLQQSTVSAHGLCVCVCVCACVLCVFYCGWLGVGRGCRLVDEPFTAGGEKYGRNKETETTETQAAVCSKICDDSGV